MGCSGSKTNVVIQNATANQQDARSYDGKDGGSTERMFVEQDGGSTGRNALEQDRGSTGRNALEQDRGSTGRNSLEQDKGSTGGKPIERDAGYTNGNPVDQDPGSPSHNSIKQNEGFTDGKLVEHVKDDGGTGDDKPLEQDGESTGRNIYMQVDNHARQAPESVKGSIADLVNYLSTPSKQPKMLVRAIFVWVSENIKYDADGYFGRTERLPGDALSVIKNGKSVCEGYANVVQELCRQANVNVKKISGYAKGVSHSQDRVITTNENPNHAWNAVELDGKWWLIDGTWGAGHMNNQHRFEKKFNEFYFLADPEKLINTHFPYMDRNMESSLKWQLLKQPVSLDEFNRTVRRWPESYNLNVKPVSHNQGYIEVNGRFEMTFKISGKHDVDFKMRLMLYEGNFIKEIQNTTFGQRDGSMYRIQICPPKEGKYDLTLFGKKSEDEGQLSQLFKYLLKCKKQTTDIEFRYPEAYLQAQKDRCILHEPLKNNLSPNSQVKICLSSPFLLRVMINKEFLKKNGNKFEGMVKTGSSGTRMAVYGSRQEGGSLQGLYIFDIQ